VSIERTFGITFSIAVALEIVRLVVGYSSPVAEVALWAGYLMLAALGFLLASAGHSYRTAFANTWPFVILWLVLGLDDLTFDPRAWPPGLNTSENISQARWGYVLACAMFLPVAFAATAIGVLAARLVQRGPRAPGNAP